MAADPDRAWLLQHLEEQAALVMDLASAARADPGNTDRVSAVCDEIFTMRETLDELGVAYARADNDTWGRLTPIATVRQLGLDQPDGSSVPFPLFGLPDAVLAPRWVGSTGFRGDVISRVALEHGDPPGPWVRTAVTGPLHPGAATIDPLPMIISEYLNVVGAEIADSDRLHEAIDATLARSFAGGQIAIDGRRTTFRVLRDGASWLALLDLEPDHLLYVIARGIALEDISLERVTDLRSYVALA